MASQRPPLPLRNFHGPTHPTRARRPANPTRLPGGDRHHPGTHGIVHNTKHHAYWSYTTVGDAIPDEHEMSTHKGCTCVPVPA